MHCYIFSDHVIGPTTPWASANQWSTAPKNDSPSAPVKLPRYAWSDMISGALGHDRGDGNCEYSDRVSIKVMFRQIGNSAFNIQVPPGSIVFLAKIHVACGRKSGCVWIAITSALPYT